MSADDSGATMLPLTPDQTANYGQDRTAEYVAGMVICILMVVISTALRFYAQRMVGTLATWDNWMMVFAFLFTTGLNVANLVAVANGGGIHLYRLLHEPNGMQSLLTYHKTGWLISVIVCPAYAFGKLSMLAFFYRIFWSKGKAFRLTIWIMAAVVIFLGIGSTTEMLVQCLPIHYFWDRAYLEAYMEVGTPPPFMPEGWCMPQIVHTAVPLFIGMVSDLALLIVPAWGVSGLHLSMTKKAGVLFALSMGIFAIGLDIVRIYECFAIRNAGDVTWTNTPSLIWCSVEFSAVIVCANVPAMSPLLRREWRAMRGSRGTSNQATGKSRYLHFFSNITPEEFNLRNSWKPQLKSSADRSLDSSSLQELNRPPSEPDKTRSDNNDEDRSPSRQIEISHHVDVRYSLRPRDDSAVV